MAQEQVQVQRECDNCGGGGALGIISHEMAVDAGEPQLEGQVVDCNICGGQGWVPDVDVIEVPDA